MSDLTVRVFNPGTYNADTVVGRSGELRRYYNRMLNFINDPSDTTKLINAWDNKKAPHRGQYNIMRHVLGIDMTCLTFSARATKSIKPLQLCRQLWDKMWAIKDKDSSPDGTAEGSDKNGDYWGWTYGTEATAHETNGGTGKKVMLEDGVGCMGMVTAHALHVNRDLDSTFGKAADEMVDWFVNHHIKAYDEYYRVHNRTRYNKPLHVKRNYTHTTLSEIAGQVAVAKIQSGANWATNTHGANALDGFELWYTDDKTVRLVSADQITNDDFKKYAPAIVWGQRNVAFGDNGDQFTANTTYANASNAALAFLYLEGFFTQYFGSKDNADRFILRVTNGFNAGCLREGLRHTKNKKDAGRGITSNMNHKGIFSNGWGKEDGTIGASTLSAGGSCALAMVDPTDRIGNFCELETSGTSGAVGGDGSKLMEIVFKEGRPNDKINYGSGGGTVVETSVETVAAPTNLQAVAGDRQVSLTWTRSVTPGLTGVGVYVQGEPLATVAATATSYTVAGLTNLTTYFFKVRAIKGSFQSYVSAGVTAVPTAPVAAPAAPDAPGRAFSSVRHDPDIAVNAFTTPVVRNLFRRTEIDHAAALNDPAGAFKTLSRAAMEEDGTPHLLALVSAFRVTGWKGYAAMMNDTLKAMRDVIEAPDAATRGLHVTHGGTLYKTFASGDDLAEEGATAAHAGIAVIVWHLYRNRDVEDAEYGEQIGYWNDFLKSFEARHRLYSVARVSVPLGTTLKSRLGAAVYAHYRAFMAEADPTATDETPASYRAMRDRCVADFTASSFVGRSPSGHATQVFTAVPITQSAAQTLQAGNELRPAPAADAAGIVQYVVALTLEGVRLDPSPGGAAALLPRLHATLAHALHDSGEHVSDHYALRSGATAPYAEADWQRTLSVTQRYGRWKSVAGRGLETPTATEATFTPPNVASGTAYGFREAPDWTTVTTAQGVVKSSAWAEDASVNFTTASGAVVPFSCEGGRATDSRFYIDAQTRYGSFSEVAPPRPLGQSVGLLAAQWWDLYGYTLETMLGLEG